MIKYLIWLWIIVLVFMILMIPIKLLSNRTVICPECGEKSMIKKKHTSSKCPYCGTTLRNPQR